MTDKIDFGGIRAFLDSMPILPKEKGPYTFEEKDGVVYMRNKQGTVCAHMPKDVYDDIMKMEHASK